MILVLILNDRIYDTKFIAENSKFRSELTSSSLNGLLSFCLNGNSISTNLEVKLAQGFDSYDLTNRDSKFHEAGYDAFITGYVFSKMFNSLNQEEKKFVTNSINVMKSLNYFKNGFLNHEEPWFQNVNIYLIIF